MSECPKNKKGSGNPSNGAQSSSVAPPDMVDPRGDTSCTGEGTNPLYAITSHQLQENSLDVIAGMIEVFTFDVYDLLDPESVKVIKYKGIGLSREGGGGIPSLLVRDPLLLDRGLELVPNERSMVFMSMPREILHLPPGTSNTLYIEGLPPDNTRRELAYIL
ncbi:uncharacterized protein LOC107001155 [Solanum pennellii]|uniref:Uncharacterized protein LOC107001155 n=1 Tax=Solanum pennellii TaxID=28526 RepID=A0ABM1FCA8_SOLPN|nr:uncharacterized protein LOC107001155 [Solanum pennellii]